MRVLDGVSLMAEIEKHLKGTLAFSSLESCLQSALLPNISLVVGQSSERFVLMLPYNLPPISDILGNKSL